MEKRTAPTEAGILIATGVSIKIEIPLERPIPNITPNNPPILVRTAASVKN